MRLLFTTFMALTLTACANAPVGWGESHEIALANDEAITIVYDPMMGGYNAAQQTAAEHCDQYDKSPVPTVSGNRGILPTQTYDCR